MIKSNDIKTRPIEIAKENNNKTLTIIFDDLMRYRAMPTPAVRNKYCN